MKIVVFHTLLICLLVSGCAQKRWTDALTNEENSAMEQLIAAMQHEEQSCAQSLDADIKMFWKTPVADQAVHGYLQLLAPSSMKFIVSNPLGQPVFVFAGNGKTFQLLNPLQYRHIRGNVYALTVRKEIPSVLSQGDWFAYLTGRLPVRPLSLLETANDKSDNTVWLKLAASGKQRTKDWIYLHLDQEHKELLGYLFLDDSGKTLAEIRYAGKREAKQPCAIQTEITVSGLPWGAEIRIELENIASGNGRFDASDFSLPVPAGFNKQLWP